MESYLDRIDYCCIGEESYNEFVIRSLKNVEINAEGDAEVQKMKIQIIGKL